MKKLTMILMMLAFGIAAQPVATFAEDGYDSAMESSEGDMDDSYESYDDGEESGDYEEDVSEDYEAEVQD